MLNRRWKCITLLVLSCVPWSELLAVLRGSLFFRAEKLNRSTVSPQVSFGLSRDQLDLQGPLSSRCNLHSSETNSVLTSSHSMHHFLHPFPPFPLPFSWLEWLGRNILAAKPATCQCLSRQRYFQDYFVSVDSSDTLEGACMWVSLFWLTKIWQRYCKFVVQTDPVTSCKLNELSLSLLQPISCWGFLLFLKKDLFFIFFLPDVAILQPLTTPVTFLSGRWTWHRAN